MLILIGVKHIPEDFCRNYFFNCGLNLKKKRLQIVKANRNNNTPLFLTYELSEYIIELLYCQSHLLEKILGLTRYSVLVDNAAPSPEKSGLICLHS